jgi:glycosyltransferase involved in cell wall biosynthesis
VLRALGAYTRLVWRYLSTGSHQVVIVGYPGYADIVLARLLNLFHRRLLVLVSFISLYDTIVLDREKVDQRSWTAKLLYSLDRLAFRCADVVLVDTREVADYFARVFSLDRGKFHRSMVGNIFDGFAPAGIHTGERTPLKVLFFGTYVPLHGIEHILEAADLLGEEEFEFTLIGRGQLYESVRGEAERRQLKRVHFIDEWINTEGLVEQMRSADVCLGIFGTTPKAGRVIPYKVFGALALRRPVVTRDSPAVREMLVDGESALLCEAGSGASLASALRRLRDERGLAEHLASAGFARYGDCASAAAIGRDLLQALEARCER